ncbi:SEC-C metal-binding domain-containing protein [Chryseolinea serpens]
MSICGADKKYKKCHM